MAATELPPICGRAVESVVALLGAERMMTLAFNRSDGWPQITTVGNVNEGLTLYYLTARASQKLANLRPSACVGGDTKRGRGRRCVGITMACRDMEDRSRPHRAP